MQIKVFAGFFMLITSVLAGGYAGALERVWLFYAYQIDGLNIKDHRTIGYKCLAWDDVAKKCRETGKRHGWGMCRGTIGPEKRCNINKFLNQLGRISNTDKIVEDADTPDPDPRSTAENLYKHYSDASKFKNPGVLDWHPYRILKDAGADYLDAVEKISDVVAKTSAELRAKAGGKPLDKDTEKLFQRFEECTRLIETARIGDHGPYLIDAAEKYLKPRGIEVKKETLDPPVNPVDSTRKWETVDWEKTVDEAVKAGKGTKEQLKDLMEETKKAFYGSPAKDSPRTKDQDVANDHRVTIEAYTNALNKAVGCLPEPPKPPSPPAKG
jgi:hypothetical protein